MQWFKRACVSLVTAALLVAGCSKSSDAVAEQAVAQPGVRTILQKIPADTPYVFVGLGGSVRPFVDKLAGAMGPMLDQLGKLMDAMPTGGDGPEQKLLRAVLAEVRGAMTVEGIEKLGFDIDGHYALYGIGVLPAARWSLKDPAALRAALTRIQESGGVQFPTCKLGDIEYWCGGDSKVKVAAAIVGDELVFGMAPAGMEDRVFGLLLGRDAPAQSLADTAKLREILGAWGIGRFSAGFVDARALTEGFLGEGDPLTRDTIAALAPEVAARWPQVTDVCKLEIRELAELAPRMVFGTESLDATGFEGMFAVELKPGLAAELAELRAPVPGLAPELRDTTLMAMGAGVDFGKAIEFALRRAQVVQKDPFACPDLAPLNEMAAEVIKGATEQVPPFVSQLRGFSFALQDVKMSGFLPTTIQGYAVLATADPKGLYEYARTQIPQIGQYAFTDDGAPVTLPDGTVPFVNGIAYAAKSGRGLAVAVGAGSSDMVQKLLGEADLKDPPLALFSYNIGRFMGEMGSLIGMSGNQEVSAILGAYKIFGPAGYTLHATDRGLVARTGVKLQ